MSCKGAGSDQHKLGGLSSASDSEWKHIRQLVGGGVWEHNLEEANHAKMNLVKFVVGS